ncbi:hypothetical protein ABZ826_22455 [Streptomyces sp. NPDC047515]|uniref:hypothetical protein n=1 Tax=Streptomyces sp. NPDC047515 TaxID=3155380 RepID=UPI003404FB73
MMNYHILGAPLTPIPVVDDTIQRMVDVGTAEYLNHANTEVDQKTREDLINHFGNGQREMNTLLEQMAHSKGVKKKEMDASPGEFEDHLQGLAEQWYQHGIKDADMKMGER